MFLRQLSILLQQHFAIRTAEPVKLFLELLIPSLFTVFFAVGVWISHPIHRDAQQFAGKVTDASIIIEMTGAFCQNASKLPPTAPAMIAASDAATTTATSARRPGAMKLSFGAESSMVGPCMKPPQGCLNAPFEDVCMPSFEMTFKMFQMATFSGVASAPRLPMSLDVHAMMASFSNDKLNGGSFFSLIDPINSVGRIVTVGPQPHVAAFRSFCIDLSEACARLLWPDTKLSEDAAVALSKARDDIWVVIVFAGTFDPMGRAEYTIRMTPSRLPPTASVETPLGRNASDANSVVLYSASGFLLFQRIVNDFILTQAGAVSQGGMAGFGAVGPSSTWTFGNMPLPKHVHSDYLHFCFKFLPIIMTFCFMYPMARLAAALTEEREYGRLPLMTAFGVKPLPHRAAWAIVATIINVIAAIFATIVGAPTVFHSAPWTLLLVVHLFYAMNLSSVAVAVSACCRRSHVAAVAAPFVIFASTIPHFTMPGNLPVWVSWVLSVFLPANAYPSALSHLGEFSAAGVEYTWADAFSATKSLQRFPVAASLLTLVLNSILCLAAGWLFAAVRDGELQWRLHSLLFSKAAESCPVPEEHGGGAGVNSRGSALQTTQGEVAVELRNVSKRFGDVDAVRDISFGLKTANVTTMLGRNGAGKSTTMSLLCGTSSPTDGHVVRSSASGDAGATRHVGLCPQDNVLWPMLSVEANIRYAALLSADTDSVSGATASAASIAETTALLEIDQAMLAANAEELSQGQQRRVCIAMALVGGCDLIVLDEPTAGIDAQARRAIWAAIRQARAAGRAVLVSTHDMIEADALSDTLLILEHGRIKVHGAYDDLKRKASSNDTGCPVISPHTTGNTGAGASTLRGRRGCRRGDRHAPLPGGQAHCCRHRYCH